MTTHVLGVSASARAMSEREIQSAFERAYEQIEPGLKWIASFVGTGRGIIDSLAIDQEGNPVVLEFKREGASTYDALIQAMDYAVWCSENFEWIEKTIRNTGHSDPIQRDIRIMVVASEFDERIKNAARALEFDISLSRSVFMNMQTTHSLYHAPNRYPPRREDLCHQKQKTNISLGYLIESCDFTKNLRIA